MTALTDDKLGRCIEMIFTDLGGRLSAPVYCSNSSSGRIHFIIGDPDNGNFYYFKKDRQ